MGNAIGFDSRHHDDIFETRFRYIRERNIVRMYICMYTRMYLWSLELEKQENQEKKGMERRREERRDTRRRKEKEREKKTKNQRGGAGERKGMERKEAAGSGSRNRRMGEADEKSVIIIITAERPTIINHH